MAEMKVFLAIMARKLDFDIIGVDVENMKWKKEEVIAVPKDGVLVSVRPSDTSRLSPIKGQRPLSYICIYIQSLFKISTSKDQQISKIA